ncbi:hypothetical protein AWB81_08502 [Caballeronia arationis]|nr:hypothetical protein AWB81_08502 [Caballeronia arationis]
MQNGTHTRDAVVQLQVTVAIPCQRADPVGGLDTEARQHIGHLARATVAVAESVAMDIALHPPGHDLRIAMMAVGMHNE